MPAEPFVALLYAFANPASIGDNQIVAAVPNKRIRVLAYTLSNQVATANNVKFRSAANDKTSLKTLPANTAVSILSRGGDVFAPAFECNVGEALNLNLSAGTSVGIDVTYQLV